MNYRRQCKQISIIFKLPFFPVSGQGVDQLANVIETIKVCGDYFESRLCSICSIIDLVRHRGLHICICHYLNMSLGFISPLTGLKN